ncbi:hypothetical protein [Sinorhizobium fredii]|uniref:ATP dependent DNA ligase n=1 Tax=Rhizobium fredii TaxID=380 RepID=UPI003F7FE765
MKGGRSYEGRVCRHLQSGSTQSQCYARCGRPCPGVQPSRLVAEIEYRAWTDDQKLRHPSLKGIRERADDATVYSLGE